MKKTSSVQDKLLWLQLKYRDNPVLFAEHVIGLSLSDQQKELLNECVKPDARVACKSATGTGKTTTAAIIILHQLITEPSCKILATAPSSGQLQRGLRAELAHLHGRMDSTFASFYDFRQELVFIQGKKETQFCSLVSTDTDNKESLAGVHAGKVLVIMDEASATDQDKYDTLMGNLTTKGSSIIQISNPVRSDGPFRSLWSNPENAEIWTLITLDAFGCPFISEEWISLMRANYGEDSDFWRMRVLGEFPRVSEDTFFPAHLITQAVDRQLHMREYYHFPKLCGVDVARMGNDSTCFVIRQGPKIVDVRTYSKMEPDEVAAELMLYYGEHKFQTAFIDANGLGAGVYAIARHRMPCVDLMVQGKSNNPAAYSNLRAQLYGDMKVWLSNGADIPNNQRMIDEFLGMRYGFNGRSQIQLMSKKEMKSKFKLDSPDIIDAISFTFAEAAFTDPRRLRPQVRQTNRRGFYW